MKPFVRSPAEPRTVTMGHPSMISSSIKFNQASGLVESAGSEADESVRIRSLQDRRTKAVLLNDTSSNRHYGSILSMQQLKLGCAEAGIDIAHVVRIGEDWRTESHLDAIAAADLVIVNGEGTLHHAKKKARVLVEVAPFCKRMAIKSCLVNTVYQSNEEIAEQVKQFDLVFVREGTSERQLAEAGIEATKVPDAIFGLDAIPKPEKTAEIVFTDSVEDAISGRLHLLSSQYPNSVYLTLKAELDDEPGQPAREKDKVSRGAAKRDEKRRERNQALRAMNAYVAPSQDVLLTRLARAKFIVTGRFHAVCLALLCGTPFVALPSNTHKIEGMLEDVGMADRLVGLESVEDVVQRGDHSDWRGSELEKVKRYVSDAKRSLRAMFASIRDLATNADER